jgi:5-methylcytosine-specific restriction endonuclease McrA
MDPITTALGGDDNGREQMVVPLTTALATPAALALHNNFRSAVRALQRDLVRSISYVVTIHDRKVHRALGYASITEYAAAVAGFSRSQTETFLALGRGLGRYPHVRRALTEGTLSWSKARIIVERARPEEERHWLEAASRLSVRELADALSTAAREEMGGIVAVVAAPAPTLTVPRREASASPAGAAVSTAPASAPAAEAAPVPAAAMPPTPAPAIKYTTTAPPGDVCHVTYAFTPEEYALWSAAHEVLRKLGRRESRAQLLVEALTGLAPGRDASRGSVGPRYLLHLQLCPTCDEAAIITHRGRHAASSALLAASRCDALIEDDRHRRRSVIPPRIRREVLRRDGHRCQAPGCGHMAFLEVHHRVPVAAGGRTIAGNLVTLCARCHRELHRREEDLRQAGRDPVAG